MSKVLAVVFPILFIISINLAYGEPTPYNEWDFRFENINVTQDPNLVNQLIITGKVYFLGDLEKGSVHIYSINTDSEGNETISFTSIYNIQNKTSQSFSLSSTIDKVGTYNIHLIMKTTYQNDEIPRNHIFDELDLIYEVPPLGFEKRVASSGVEEDDYIEYVIDDSVRHTQVVHLLFDLPQIHEFENIVVVNGNYTKYFDINTDDLYLKSKYSYDDTFVYLLEQGGIIPLAYPQEPFQEYVKIYSVNLSICKSVTCTMIDFDEQPEEPEFPILLLEIIVISVLISISIGGWTIILKIKKRKKKSDQSIGSIQKPVDQY